MQKNATISEMNEAIARFMGGVKQIIPTGGLHGYKESTVLWMYLFSDNADPLRSLEYDTSWDWLMPVVEKIEEMEWCVRIENWPKKFESPYKEHYSVWMWLDPEECPEIQTYSDSKIEAVHEAVYQFITWYNQQKQNDE